MALYKFSRLMSSLFIKIDIILRILENYNLVLYPQIFMRF